jgi:sec-independent protein translocase protein TatB
MLDFGFSEILLTSAIALVVLGPERLPKVARQVGHWMGRARSMARQLSEQLEREVSADELLKEQSKARAPLSDRIAPPQMVPPGPVHMPHEVPAGTPSGMPHEPPSATPSGAPHELAEAPPSYVTAPPSTPDAQQSPAQ